MRLPLREPVGGSSVREAVLLEGPAGWGEVSPLPGYRSHPGRARAAAEEAACLGWPRPVRDVVPVGALIPAVTPERAAVLAAEALAAGVACLKVKIGRGDDEGRLSAVRDTAGPALRLRVDANGLWSLEEAAAALARLARFDLELAEDPVASLEDLARLRRRVAVPVAADESVRDLADAKRLAVLAAADAIVLKVQALGGVRASLAVAEEAGVPAVVGSMLETSVGLAAGLALAACLQELSSPCGLGTGLLLGGDVAADPVVPRAGVLRVRPVVPDPALLARYRAA